jgi:hypothetical protein
MVVSVDFKYAGATGHKHKSNVHVLTEDPSDVGKLMAERFPYGLEITGISTAELPLPIILDEFYRDMG